MELKAGLLIAGDAYELIAPLGEGGQAEVWKAREHRGEHAPRDVALKFVLNKDVKDPEIEAMLLQEALVSSQLQHPNIVEVYDVGHTDEWVYIAMELIDGIDLNTLLKKSLSHFKRPFPWRLVALMAAQLCKGLQYAHLKTDKNNEPLHLVHRDLKPGNILLTSSGEAKIIDFGIAKIAKNVSKTKTGHIKGTPAFMSPEQVRSEKLDWRSDLFSLGVTLYEMTTGRRAFAGNDLFSLMFLIVGTRPEEISAIISDSPAAFDDIIFRLMEKAPADRYQSAHELELDLERLLRDYQEESEENELVNLYSILSEEIDDDEKYTEFVDWYDSFSVTGIQNVQFSEEALAGTPSHDSLELHPMNPIPMGDASSTSPSELRSLELDLPLEQDAQRPSHVIFNEVTPTDNQELVFQSQPSTSPQQTPNFIRSNSRASEARHWSGELDGPEQSIIHTRQVVDKVKHVRQYAAPVGGASMDFSGDAAFSSYDDIGEATEQVSAIKLPGLGSPPDDPTETHEDIGESTLATGSPAILPQMDLVGSSPSLDSLIPELGGRSEEMRTEKDVPGHSPMSLARGELGEPKTPTPSIGVKQSKRPTPSGNQMERVFVRTSSAAVKAEKSFVQPIRKKKKPERFTSASGAQAGRAFARTSSMGPKGQDKSSVQVLSRSNTKSFPRTSSISPKQPLDPDMLRASPRENFERRASKVAPALRSVGAKQPEKPEKSSNILPIFIFVVGIVLCGLLIWLAFN